MDKQRPIVVGINETLAWTMEHFRKSGGRFTADAQRVLGYCVDDGMACEPGRAQTRVITTGQEGAAGPLSLVEMHYGLLSMGYGLLCPQHAIRLALELDSCGGPVRFLMEPLNDNGWDVVLTCTWTNDIPVIDVTESGLWTDDGEAVLSPDAKIAVRDRPE
jgi:hypothetical protein